VGKFLEEGGGPQKYAQGGGKAWGVSDGQRKKEVRVEGGIKERGGGTKKKKKVTPGPGCRKQLKKSFQGGGGGGDVIVFGPREGGKKQIEGEV